MDEIETIRESVKKLAENEIPKFQSGNFYNTVPRELFSKFAELGLTGLSIAEEYNGSQQSAKIIAAVIEEISKVDAGAAIFLSVHLMVSGLINKFANPEQKAKYLPALASGKMLAAFALTEPQAGSDASALKSSATLDNKTWKLNGEKCYITSAGFAELYLVFAKTGQTGKTQKNNISAFLLEAKTVGLTISNPDQKMGAELSPIASLSFNQIELPESALLGEVNTGYQIALSGLAGGRINIAACALGIADTAIKKSKEYLNTREQFGQKIAEFQGLQFMFADMYQQYSAARLLCEQATNQLDQDPKSKNNRIYPALAKCFATDACMKITTDAVQIFGGAGYLKDYGMEKLMRDAKMLQIVEGSNQIQRVIIAREVLGKG